MGIAEDKFEQAVRDAAQLFNSRGKRDVVLFHHNDADGLSSGAILHRAFERKGLRPRRQCLEKPYPAVIEKVLDDPLLEPDTSIVITDFGSGMIPEIVRLNRERFDIFILDHHTVAPARSPKLHVVNCRDFGINGDDDCSASAICALFAEALDPLNADLMRLGVSGALGDLMVKSDGSLSGINRIVFDRSSGVRRTGSSYEFEVTPNTWIGAADLIDYVNVLGSCGYYEGGPDIALKGLLEGFDERYVVSAQSYLTAFNSAVENFFNKGNVATVGDIQWFTLDDSFDGMGVKTVGLVCEAFMGRPECDHKKYVAGFQLLPNEIPGIGPVALGKGGKAQVKISMRVPAALRTRVEKGERPTLTELLPPATNALGGFVDACHRFAAATTIDRGREGELIAEMGKILGSA